MLWLTPPVWPTPQGGLGHRYTRHSTSVKPSHDLDHTCRLDHTRSPWVTRASSPPCRPHTPWCDGVEPSAFASIVQARPFPILGRPVHLWDGSHRLRPGGSPQALQTPPHGGRPALRSPLGGGFRSTLAVSRFRLRARLGFSIP